jgi:hypothetical protein
MMARNFFPEGTSEVDWGGPGPNYKGHSNSYYLYRSILYKIVGQHDWVRRCVAVAFVRGEFSFIIS